MIPTEASLLRLYLDASDRWHGRPLFEAVVAAARARPMAGASVFPVDLSYGTHRQIHDALSEYRFAHLPVVIEVVDAPDRVDALTADLVPMVAEGLATVEPVRVIRYADHGAQPRPATSPGARAHPPPPGADPLVTGKEPPMPDEGQAQRLTVYIGSSDTWHGGNLAVAIVERCRKLGMAGATASRGVMGFGKQSVIHRAHLLGLSDDLPERIEIVDTPDRIASLLPVLDQMVEGGLVVLEDVRVIHYHPHPGRPKP
jgi:PII-like signaling protein